MTDPLGQSQVIPYLQKLAGYNYEIHILSAEKPMQYEGRKEYISGLLQASNIYWHPIGYTKKPPVLSTIKDVFKLIGHAKKLHRQFDFQIVHCRSYIAAFAGIALKKNFGVKFLFDMRGFYADERVDGDLWPQGNPVYKMVYRYFKRREKQFFNQADYTISLTYKGRDIIHGFEGFAKIPIEVIPCCADISLFDYHRTDSAKQDVLRKELQLDIQHYTLCYLGSLGTWYMPDEMMLFFGLLLQKKPEARFLFITRDDPSSIYDLADTYKVPHDTIRIRPAHREEVPLLISLCRASLFFIKPVFSKSASSPTKLAELLGMGVPVVCNAGVGDIDRFVPEYRLGILIEKTDEAGFRQAINHIDDLDAIDREHLRSVADELFSLERGVERYVKVYNQLSAS